jgi:hypothetical protein
MLVPHEIKKIFQSQRDRLRNADEPHMMRPKNKYKPLRGVARLLYLDRKAKLSKAESVANSGLGLAYTKLPKISTKKEEKEDEKVKEV